MVLLPCGVLVPLWDAVLPAPRLLNRPPEDGAVGLAPPPNRLLVPGLCCPDSGGFGVDVPDAAPNTFPPLGVDRACWPMLPNSPPLLGAGAALPKRGALVLGVESLSLLRLPKMLLPPELPPPNAGVPDPCCPGVFPNRLGVEGFAASGAELAGVLLWVCCPKLNPPPLPPPPVFPPPNNPPLAGVLDVLPNSDGSDVAD